MEKTELKKGQWYTINNLGFEKVLFCFERYDEFIVGYGFDRSGKWSSLSIWFDAITPDFSLCNELSVKYKLGREAYRRGIRSGVTLHREHMFSNTDSVVIKGPHKFEFDAVNNVFYLNGKEIFSNGKWAKVIEKIKDKPKGWVPSETIGSELSKDILRYFEDEITRISERDAHYIAACDPISENSEVKVSEVEPPLEINNNYIKNLSDEELENLARELQIGIGEFLTTSSVKRDADLLGKVSEEYIRRQEVKYHEEEDRKKNLDISQVAVSEFMRHMWEKTGIAIPNKYFQSFFEDK